MPASKPHSHHATDGRQIRLGENSAATTNQSHAADTKTPARAPSGLRGVSLQFIPAQPLQRSTRYEAVIAAGAKAANGAQTASSFTTSFTTIPLPAIVSVKPENGASAAELSGFTINFSAPVSPATILQNLTFVPAISLTDVYSYYDSYTNQFNLGAELKPSTLYRVNIADGIRDDFGAIDHRRTSHSGSPRARWHPISRSATAA